MTVRINLLKVMKWGKYTILSQQFDVIEKMTQKVIILNILKI